MTDRPSGPPGPIEEFFTGLQEVHDRARRATAGQGVEQTLDLAGTRLELRFAGPALADRLLPALRHLPAGDAARADLSIGLWDSVSTGTAMPAPPWDLTDCVERGEVRGFSDRRYRTAYFLGSGVLNMIDLEQGRGLFWLRDAASLALWEAGAPLLAMLNWWFSSRRKQVVHGAAVGYPEGGVLLAGRGGSGKSTTALACLASDLLYAGDDYCLLETEPEPHVHSLYNSAKLNRDNLERLPELDRLFRQPSARIEEKALVFLEQHEARKLSTGFPLKGVLLPQVTGLPGTTLEQVSPAEALRALAPSTLFQLSGTGRSAFELMAALVRRVPCLRLRLGTDLDGVTGAIRRYLEGAPA